MIVVGGTLIAGLSTEIVGGILSGVALVVNDNCTLAWVETMEVFFPGAKSTAVTVKKYVVSGVKPVMVTECVHGVATQTPSPQILGALVKPASEYTLILPVVGSSVCQETIAS